MTTCTRSLCSANCGVLLWLETDLNQNLTDQVDSVQYYINITTLLSNGDNDTVKQITLDPLFQVQNIRCVLSLEWWTLSTLSMPTKLGLFLATCTHALYT